MCSRSVHQQQRKTDWRVTGKRGHDTGAARYGTSAGRGGLSVSGRGIASAENRGSFAHVTRPRPFPIVRDGAAASYLSVCNTPRSGEGRFLVRTCPSRGAWRRLLLPDLGLAPFAAQLPALPYTLGPSAYRFRISARVAHPTFSAAARFPALFGRSAHCRRRPGPEGLVGGVSVYHQLGFACHAHAATLERERRPAALAPCPWPPRIRFLAGHSGPRCHCDRPPIIAAQVWMNPDHLGNMWFIV